MSWYGSPSIYDGVVSLDGPTWQYGVVYPFQSSSNFPVGFSACTIGIWFKFSANSNSNDVSFQPEFAAVGSNSYVGARLGLSYCHSCMNGVSNVLFVEMSTQGQFFYWTLDYNWHFFAVSIPSSSILSQSNVFFDGLKVTTITVGSKTSAILNIDNNGAWVLGTLPNVPQCAGTYCYNFQGQLKNYFLYNRKLTDSEIVSIWRHTSL